MALVMPIGKRTAGHQRGLAFIALLLIIAVIGVIASSAVRLGAVSAQRSAEEALLDIGGEFQRALVRYAQATPNGLPREPATLEALLRDPRYPGVVRHLRQIYSDPLTGAPDWVLLRNAAGGIVALHSRSHRTPVKQAGFDRPLSHLASRQARTYQDWLFIGPSADPLMPGGS